MIKSGPFSACFRSAFPLGSATISGSTVELAHCRRKRRSSRRPNLSKRWCESFLLSVVLRGRSPLRWMTELSNPPGEGRQPPQQVLVVETSQDGFVLVRLQSHLLLLRENGAFGGFIPTPRSYSATGARCFPSIPSSSEPAHLLPPLQHVLPVLARWSRRAAKLVVDSKEEVVRVRDALEWRTAPREELRGGGRVVSERREGGGEGERRRRKQGRRNGLRTAKLTRIRQIWN